MKCTLLRTFAAAVAAAALSASGFAINAAAQSDQQPTRAELVQRWAEAALDGQLKGMKTSLRLTADQEKLWGPFESAVKDGAKTRVVTLQREQNDNLSPMARLNTKAERISQSAANLRRIIEAAKPLYAGLDDAQKHKFITLGRLLVPERGRFAMEMKRLRVGEGDQHGAAPAAIGGKLAPRQAASAPATTTPGASGAASAPSAAASAPEAASPKVNGATSAPRQAASAPATTTPGAASAPSAAASAPDAAEPAASGATAGPSGTASAPTTTTPAAIGVTESAPEAAPPAASGATAEPSGTASAPTTTTPAAIGATSTPSGVESRPKGATAEPSGATAAPSETASGHGATASAASGTMKAPKGATAHASVRRYANHYTYHSRHYGTAYGRNPVAAAVRGVFGGVADLGSLAAYPVYCFPHYGRCHVFVPY
jgi:LTXXQ motif family protein